MPRKTDLPRAALETVGTEIAYRDRAGALWMARVDFVDVDGQFQMCGLRVRSFSEDRDTHEAVSYNEDWARLDTNSLRSVAVARIESLARQALLKAHPDVLEARRADRAALPAAEVDRLVNRANRVISRARARGPKPRHSPEHWEAVAAAYRHAYASGDRAPAKAVAEKFNVAPAAARSWIRRCREMDLLPKTAARKAKA